MLDFSSGQLAAVVALGAVFASSVTVIRQWLVPGTKRPQLHHFYYGLVVLAPVPDWVTALGFAMLIDDAGQHLIQALQLLRRGAWTFYSPMYRLYVWAYGEVERLRWPCPRCDNAARAVLAYHPGGLGSRVVLRRAKWCHECLATP